MLDAIRIYLAIAETGSLSQVARQENLAVSSVSRKLDTLEADLGFKLFNRSSRRMMLTDAGEQFLPRAKNIKVAEAQYLQSVHIGKNLCIQFICSFCSGIRR